ncbi:restriction endonuclease subunit S [Vreelandella alkaliphila]
MEYTKFPSDWSICLFSDLVASSFTGLVRSAREQGFELNFKYLKMNNLDNKGSFRLEDLVRVNAEENEVEKYSLDKGDFIFNTRNSFELVGKCGVFDIEPQEPILFNNNLLKVKFFSVEPRLVAHWLNSPLGKGDLRAITSATTSVAAIYQKQLFGLKLPLPPLAEQKMIADKLDTLLAKVDTTKVRLERIPQILKTFRQSVLAAAVRGKLTVSKTEWRNESLENCFECIDGDRGPNYPKKDDYLSSGYCLFLSTKNVRQFGFDFSDTVFLSKEKDSILRKGKLKRGDIVITTRGTLGYVASYDKTVPYDVVRINSGMLILRKKDEKLVNDYFKILLASPYFQKMIEDQRTGSAQPQLPAKIIKNFILPVPGCNDQANIVRRVEELFVFADSIEQKVNAALERVNNLTQSILAKAFRGELTADWRAANPDLISGENSSEVLLDKIKAEREALRPAKKTAARKKD